MPGRLGMSCSRCATEARPAVAKRSGVAGAISTSAAALGALGVAGIQAAVSGSSCICMAGAGSASMPVQWNGRPSYRAGLRLSVDGLHTLRPMPRCERYGRSCLKHAVQSRPIIEARGRRVCGGC